MAEVKKRLTISLAKNVFEDLEKMAKDKGLSKSALLTIAIENLKKGQKWV